MPDAPQRPRLTPPPGPTAERERQLRDLFPEAVSEGKLDFERLRELVGESGAGAERYQFSWAGRADAIDVLRTPSRATLLPDPERSLDFDATKNAVIEGDNLEVLKLLARGHAGRVKLIYIDPPYNTGNDFVYPDDFRDPLGVYLKLTGQADAAGNRLTSNPDTGGRYHSNWLSMMYPRLFLARQLLRDDGVICVSIDDHEVHHLRMLMNEVFGEENFVAHIVWQKRYVSNVTAKYLSDMHDHVLVYGRVLDEVKVQRLERTEEQIADYKNPDNDERGPWRAQDLSASKPYKAGEYTITTPAGLEVNPPPGRWWRCHRAQYDEWIADNRITFGKSGNGRPMLKAFLSEVQSGLTPNTWWSHDYAGHNKEATLEVKELFGGTAPFDTAKPVKLLRRLLETFSDKSGTVLDFFAGSGTTAQAVLELNREDGGNRRFMLVQLPEPTGNKAYPTIADICCERVRRVSAKLKAAPGDLTRTASEDLGFKLFRLAESHLKSWAGTDDRTPEGYIQALTLFGDETLVPGWTEPGLLWEIALSEGYGLNSTLERVPGADFAWRVTDPDLDPVQSFVAVLAKSLPADLADTLKLTADDLLVVRDSALDDTLAANLALQCRLKAV